MRKRTKAEFCNLQANAALPLLPSVSAVDPSGLWLIRLLYLTSTSCRRNSSLWDGNDHSVNYIYGCTDVLVPCLQIAEVGLKASEVRQNLSAERREAARLWHGGKSRIAARVDGAASQGMETLPWRRRQDVVICAALPGTAVALQHQISCWGDRESHLAPNRSNLWNIASQLTIVLRAVKEPFVSGAQVLSRFL